jgi:hypothetical protein
MESFTSITFEANSRLSRLEKTAFFQSGLRSLHVPASVEVICESCFCECSSLTSVTFDSLSKLQRIEGSALAWTKLTDLRIPGCVNWISGSPLIGVPLQNFSISGISTTYFISGSFLIHYFGRDGDVIIGNSVEVICARCFAACRSFSWVRFENNSRLSRVEESAFHMAGLERIHLPGSVEVIGAWCFASCRSLATVIFDTPSRLSRLERGAFYDSGLRSIHLPASLEVIGESCFSGCNFLRSVILDPQSRL